MVQRIQSVERALALLDILAKSPRPQTIPELAKTMEINRATAWRLINTLLEFELVQKDDEWVIQTTGSNIAKVLEVPGIDKKNVRTNNVFEIAGTLGIEASRNALINELNNTLEDQGLEVDNRYIMLVSDLMCSRGYMQQIGRHGIAGTKDSVLARAAFEITVPTIAHAALFPVPPVKPTKAYSLLPFTKPQIFAVPLLVKGKKLFNMMLLF